MNPSLTFAAVLLAGGRSRRMGRDKALLEVGGRALWVRQVELLRAAGVQEILFSVRPEQTWVPSVARRVPDAVPDAGPLAGIVAGLESCEASHLMVLAVDLPQMEPGWFRRLREQCEPGLGAVGRHGDFFEPLAAIYPRTILPRAKAALAAGDGSLQRLIAGAADCLRVHEITAEETPWFANWNEPEGVAARQE
jgi:molybdopterin-guanine dinucleotide biosynthesis protein A